MKSFWFGPRQTGERVKIDAVSLKRAIRMFRVGTQFPHTYSNKRIRTTAPGSRGYEESVYLSSDPEGMVEVWATEINPDTHSTNWVKLTEIPPEAPEGEEGFQAIRSLLSAETSPLSGALVTASALTGLGNLTRREMDEKQLELNRLLGELEQAKHALNEQVDTLRAELQRRLKQIWLIELFLGSQEEVQVLRHGTPAPADTRIAVRQQILCMDEEIAVHDWLDNPERIGEFDFNNIGDFDRWLLKDPSNLDVICPWMKGIVGLRVRRKSKDRSDLGFDLGAVMERSQFETWDEMVYILVRNGESLYRLWVDVKLWPRFFANEDDVNFNSKGDDWRNELDAKEKGERLQVYAAGLVMVAGILQRSDLLNPLPRADLNPFDSRDVDAHFLLVRDAENLKTLGDGRAFEHLTWEGYEKWLKSQVGPGVRVMWTGNIRTDGRDTLEERTGIRSLNTPPSWNQAYVLDQWDTRAGGYKGSFLYLPNDKLWKVGEDGWHSEVERGRRFRFLVYSDEILPVDFISWRVLHALIQDRSQREHYGVFFKKAFHWYKMKRLESDKEKPFIDLILARAQVSLDNEPERARCERLLRWWKLKVKEHRTVSVDEAKALRMIEKAFKAGQDHDNDPETALLRGTSR